MNPHQVTQDFERELCNYTGAPYAVAVNSCTMALLLAVAWHLRDTKQYCVSGDNPDAIYRAFVKPVEIPKRTYVSVPQSIIHAGGRPTFRDEEWLGAYRLQPLPVWDSARWFTSDLYRAVTGSGGGMVCVSFHWSKTLGIQQGGAILHDSDEADAWLRRARFDGRCAGVHPAKQTFWDVVGWHAYMSPEIAAEGLMRLSFLPEHNEPLPADDYPALDELEIFK